MAHPAETPSPGATGDWTTQAADTIEHAVGVVRDKTAVPLTTVARAVVFGLLAAVMGATALVFLAVAAVRALDAYLPEDVWAAHVVLGGIFTLAGGLMLRKATSPRPRTTRT